MATKVKINTILKKLYIQLCAEYEACKNNPEDLSNNKLWKMFEVYTAIKLNCESSKKFYLYDDLDIEFKESNSLSKVDTGIDICDAVDTIVQCKLRSATLTLTDCATFFASQNTYSAAESRTVIKWPNLIIARNADCKLAKHLTAKQAMFRDLAIEKDEMFNFAKKLIKLKKHLVVEKTTEKLILRDYQEEAVALITKPGNLVICLPTGSGKNVIILSSLDADKKYLILVPRIVLMEQLKSMIDKYKPDLAASVCLIGDGNSKYVANKKIYIVVYNSINLVKDLNKFDKIFVDEAHHIYMPEIYEESEVVEEFDTLDSSTDSDLDNSAEDSDSDSEPEEKESFLKTIAGLSKYQNCVFLSATIDSLPNFEFYKIDIRDMIDAGYLCDYTINIPIFANDPTDVNICQYIVNKRLHGSIVYCDSIAASVDICAKLNAIEPNFARVISCNTSRISRTLILKKYQEGKISCLVNCRILTEGFDAPITKHIILMHMPSSSTTLIQIVGRALRLHPSKVYAQIHLPFSNDEDGNCISNFLAVMAKNDVRIMKSYKSKTLGGYLNIIPTVAGEEETSDYELKYELVYNSIGKLQNGIEVWMYKLEELKKYLDDNKKKPSKKSGDNRIKALYYWCVNNNTCYKNKIHIMKIPEIYKIWDNLLESTEYYKYFLTTEKLWFYTFNKFKEYIDIHKNTPSHGSKNKEIKKLGKWACHQRENYRIKTQSMKNIKIYNAWKDFVESEKYAQYFISNEDLWYLHFNNLKQYIDTHKSLPSKSSKHENIKQLNNWVGCQQRRYKIKERIMRNHIIYNTWKEFVESEEYSIYFLTNEEIWRNQIIALKEYINTWQRLPSKSDSSDSIKKLTQWYHTQVDSYKKRKNIMKNEQIRNEWSSFIESEEYENYFIDREDEWVIKLEQLKQFINKYKNTPSQVSKIPDTAKLGRWLNQQKNAYQTKTCTMLIPQIYNRWKEFVESEKYSEYFLTNKEFWYKRIQQLKCYILKHQRLPNYTTMLGRFTSRQKHIYRHKKQIMTEPEIYEAWRSFVTSSEYSQYFPNTADSDDYQDDNNTEDTSDAEDQED